MDFKVGDTVRRIICDGWLSNGQVLKIGTICKVTEVLHNGFIWVSAEGIQEDTEHRLVFFELVESAPTAPTFNMKNDPWFIRVHNAEEAEEVRRWLDENCEVKFGSSPLNIDLVNKYSFVGFTNTYNHLSEPNKYLMFGNLEVPGVRSEIKITFKKVVDRVDYPVIECLTRKRIRELEAQQQKIADEISKLKALRGTL